MYNYHRLLSWDKVRGLHVDIFKVPTCCSCQVDGYRQQFPPLSSIQAKDYSPGSYKLDTGNSNGYSTINDEDLDYNDESDEDELGLSYTPINSRDNNELSYLGSKKVRSKLPAPSSVGPYLSPPDDDDVYSLGSYKSHKGSSSSGINSGHSSSSSSKKYYNQLSRRRPQHNEPRVDVDLDLSPSETQAEQEVNVFGPPLAGEQPRVPLKRKRIYSSTHTQTAGAAAAAAASPSASVASGLPAATARVRIPISKPQSTAATSSLPARTGTAATGATGSATVGVSISAATHAHQAVAPSSPAASPNVAFGSTQHRYYTGSSQSRPRYYAPITTTPPAAPATVTFPASAATPLPTTYYKQPKQQQQSTAFPQPSHVNNIYGESSSSSSGGSGNGTRRINYNYHPIIDFFEKNRHAEVAAAAVTPNQAHDFTDYEVDESRRVEQRYPHRISSSIATPQRAIPTSHERRIGFGAGGGVGGAGSFGYASNDNAWQPLVVEP